MLIKSTRQFKKSQLDTTVETHKNNNSLISDSISFLDSVIENIPNMIFVKDAKDLKFVRFNSAGEKLIGLSRNEMIGKNDYDFFPKDQADFFTSLDRQVLSTRTIQTIPEEKLHTKNGLRILYTKKIPILNTAGEPIYLLGISEDITEKKAAEAQALQLINTQAARVEAEKSAKYFAFLAEATDILSANFNCSENFKSLTQLVCANVSEACIVDICNEDGTCKTAARYRRAHENDLPEETTKIAKHVIQSGRAFVFNNNMCQPKDAEIYFDKELFLHKLNINTVIIAPFRSFDKVAGAITFLIAEAENLHIDFEFNLAQDVAKRITVMLENSYLFDKAQLANRAKTAFLANMSHEIRTPLGAIIGFADLIIDSKDLSTEQAGFAHTIKRNGSQLLKIVDEILDISKIESERLTIEFETFSTAQAIDDVVTLMKLQADAKDLKLNVSRAEELPAYIRSDPNRLRQILINIIGNSIKFTERGHIDLLVSSVLVPTKTNFAILKFKVLDTGPGIQADQIKNLFQPFAQADSATTRKFGGTGLGLYLSKKFARALGGDLVLEKSQPGVGSTFVITIQAEVVDKSLIKNSKTDKLKINRNIKQTKKLQTLIIDDSADNRYLVGQLVTHIGHQADFAESANTGIQMALNKKYDIIFMDLQMPEMDGFEAVSTLRKRGYSMPVCALTAHAMKGDRERCLNQGFDNYLAKPINTESLRQVLENYMTTSD